MIADAKEVIVISKKQIRIVKTAIKTVTLALSLISFLLMSVIASLEFRLPDSFIIEDGNATEFSVFEIVTATRQKTDEVSKSDGSFVANLTIGGVIPVGSAVVNKKSERLVCVSGEPIGLKLYTEGVVVVGFTDVDTANGNKNPAREAGIAMGDIILSIGGNPVSSNSDVKRIIESSGGKTLTVSLCRDSTSLTVELMGVKSESEKIYKAGMWVRDSTAGLGTLTFFDPADGCFAGLGHAVYDTDTGVVLPVLTGELSTATIVSASKSAGNNAGELNGIIIEGSVLGNIIANTEEGIYGRTNADLSGRKLTPVANKQEVKTGKATVVCTVKGRVPDYYDIEIKSISMNPAQKTKNMVIEITDTKLLEATGGIVQGMSGSPIIQNGKLVGAVTHVFLNDSAKGYAIFAENMLNTADSTLPRSQMNEAS